MPVQYIVPQKDKTKQWETEGLWSWQRRPLEAFAAKVQKLMSNHEKLTLLKETQDVLFQITLLIQYKFVKLKRPNSLAITKALAAVAKAFYDYVFYVNYCVEGNDE